MNTICEQQIIRYIVAVSCIGYVRSSICFFEYKNILADFFVLFLFVGAMLEKRRVL